MRPNSRETTACRGCDAPIFFALTATGGLQPLDVEEKAAGVVAAYRGAGGRWLARTLPRERPAEAGEQLPLDGVDPDQRGRREHVAHPLERRFTVHVCGPRAVQADLFDVPSVPAPRAPSRPSPLIYNVKPGVSHNPAAEHGQDAQVFDWASRVPRIAARRRAAAERRPSAGAQ